MTIPPRYSKENLSADQLLFPSYHYDEGAAKVTPFLYS